MRTESLSPWRSRGFCIFLSATDKAVACSDDRSVAHAENSVDPVSGKAPRLNVFVSGLASAPNPSADVGLARSLRLAFRGIWLTGVDYSNRSSGIHWSDFDDVWIQRPWNEIELGPFADEIRKRLDGGACWLFRSRLGNRLAGESTRTALAAIDAFCAKGRLSGLDGPRLRMGVMLSSMKRLTGSSRRVPPPSHSAFTAQRWLCVPVSRGSISLLFALIRGERCRSPAQEGVEGWGRRLRSGPERRRR